MKKPVAIALVIVGGIPGIALFSWLALLLSIEIFPFGLLLAILAAIAATFGIDAIRRVFKRHFGLSAPKFILCAYLPSIIGTVIYWIWFLAMDNADCFSGFFAGLGEFLFAFAYSITAAAMLVLGIIWAAIFRKKE